MFNIFAVFIGGGIGSSLRYLFSISSKKYFGINCRATFVINVIGCLFLAFFSTLAVKNSSWINHNLKLFLTTGIAGGFTTFSTFSYENISLLQEGRVLTSFLYLTSSFVFCSLGIYFGYLLANSSLF